VGITYCAEYFIRSVKERRSITNEYPYGGVVKFKQKEGLDELSIRAIPEAFLYPILII
jgi:hypothetical protein